MAAPKLHREDRRRGDNTTTSGPGQPNQIIHRKSAAEATFENSVASSQQAVRRLKAVAARLDRENRRISMGFAPVLVGAVIIVTLSIAYYCSEEQVIIPQVGVGYWLGIVGALMMATLLLYPLRKYSKLLSGAGSTKVWFVAHMLLGVIGPTLVVVHSNFNFKSVNSTVAMIAMLLVVASGLVGKYVYSKIHIGLSGRRAELTDLLNEAGAALEVVTAETRERAEIANQLKAFDEGLRALRSGRLGGLALAMEVGRRIRECRAGVANDVVTAVSVRALREGWQPAELQTHMDLALANLERYFSTVRMASVLQFFSKLFGLWHVLHVPLFLLLILAAVGHVVAVHLY